MKIIGIVAEYNPFHNGHAFQVSHSKETLGADGVVAIMSGNFVQRGYPALLNKWLRAEMAVKSGVNLVLELPTYYATASAEPFAEGAVTLLHHTGVITHLSFGSEIDDLDTLSKLAQIISAPDEAYLLALEEGLKSGLSYPKARAMALLDSGNAHPSINLNQANAILVIEYLKALKKLDSSITPFIVKRRGKGYHDETLDSPMVSATGIRKAFFEKLSIEHLMPMPAAEVLSRNAHLSSRIEDFELPLLYKIRSMTPDSMQAIREVNEGLENRISEAGRLCGDYHCLTAQIKTKRYTMTRINRTLLNLYLDIDKQKPNLDKDGYFRVLAFDEIGQKIIRLIKKNGYHPIITNINKHPDLVAGNPLLQLDIKATNLYQLGKQSATDRKGGLDFTTSPYRHQTTP